MHFNAATKKSALQVTTYFLFHFSLVNKWFVLSVITFPLPILRRLIMWPAEWVEGGRGKMWGRCQVQSPEQWRMEAS